MPEPWEQLRGEPKESYRRFLFYRNLGPGRSLNLAYRVYLATVPRDLATSEEAPKSPKKPHTPGNWKDDCERYNWSERGVEWDIHQLERIGIDVAPLWAGILREGLLRSVQALANPRFKPKQWRDAFVVLQFLNADVMMALCPPKPVAGLAGNHSPITVNSTLGNSPRNHTGVKPPEPPGKSSDSPAEPTNESVE
jgi:hypothetical protein